MIHRWRCNRGYCLAAAAAGVLGSLPPWGLEVAVAARSLPSASVQRPTGSRQSADGLPGQSLAAGRPPETAFLLQAQTDLRHRQPRKAIAALEQGLAIYPRSVPLHFAAARVLAQEGDYLRARGHYQRMVALAPRVVEGYFGLAQAAFARRDYGASVAALRNVLRLQPNSATAYAKLGRSYAQEYEARKAEAALQKALALAPTSAEAHFYLGDLMLGLSRLDEAQQHLEQAIALDPGNAHFYAKLGEVSLQRQQNAANSARALAAYQQAVQRNPRLAEAHYGLGRVYARQRRWREAAGELRTALRLQPDMGRAHYTLAQVCRRLGQPGEAAAHLEAFRRYRARRPDQSADRSPKARKPAKG